MAKNIERIEDLAFDDHNANKGTEIGYQRLEDSLRYRGAGRSVLADKNGKLIAGNKTAEKAAELGMEVLVVRTSGDKLVVVQRDDLDLDADQEARLLAYEDNRIGQLSLNWDVEAITADVMEGLDLTHLFHEDYINSLVSKTATQMLKDDEPFSDDVQKQEQVAARMVKCPCGCEHFFVPTRYYDADEVQDV